MTLPGVVQRIHLWAGVLLGLQMFLWMLSGVVMSFFHLDLVRGERNAASNARPTLEARNYASPGGIVAQMDEALSIELRYFMGRPVYEVEGLTGRALFDADTGERISPLNEEIVRSIARTEFIGEGKVERLRLLTNRPKEFRGPLPVWRAEFNDPLETRLYISPQTGEVISRRNKIWRIYDFFWMLHIMDYEERSNTNNLLVKIASAGGLIFSITGLMMLFLRRGRNMLIHDVRRLTGRAAK